MRIEMRTYRPTHSAPFSRTSLGRASPVRLRHSVLALLSSLPMLAHAASDTPGTPNWQQCAEQFASDNQARLQCYDAAAAAARNALSADSFTPGDKVASATPAPADSPVLTRQNNSSGIAAMLPDDGTPDGIACSVPYSAWDGRISTFIPQSYKPMYVLPLYATSAINRQPGSDADGRTQTSDTSYGRIESKFQLSFKMLLLDNIFGNTGDFWFGYTQTSHWQVYNQRISSPFRETNYEPEFMLAFPSDYKLPGTDWTLKTTGLALNHQSNGRSLPLSRSWNRVIAFAELERENWKVAFRPWWRVPEKTEDDDNPGIQDHLGRGELIVSHRMGNHILSVTGRHSLRSGQLSRGSVQVDWTFPLARDPRFKPVKGYLQFFSGYGESLIDYNHYQNTIGLGISLVDWK